MTNLRIDKAIRNVLKLGCVSLGALPKYYRESVHLIVD